MMRLAGHPLPRPRLMVPDVLSRFVAYYRRPKNGAWGGLHVVLDDGNAEDTSVRWCLEDAVRAGDTETAELAAILLGMSRTARLKLPGAVRRAMGRAR